MTVRSRAAEDLLDLLPYAIQAPFNSSDKRHYGEKKLKMCGFQMSPQSLTARHFTTRAWK
jgi:hypothetical protein